MSTKNLMDTDSNQRPVLLDDKTGQYLSEPRMELEETLAFVQSVYLLLQAAANPAPHRYAIHFAVQATCRHMGWLPYELAAAEQYIKLMSPTGSAATVG